MTVCRALSGIINSCENAVGGLDKTFWLFFKSDLNTQISLKQDKDVDHIDFGVYEGFLRFDGQKFQHQFSSPLVRSDVGNVSYMPNVIVKILSGSTATDVILQMLSQAQDIIALVQDNNREFFILGAGNGLFVSGDDQGTGVLGDYDVSDVFTLTGAEVTKPLRFSLGDYQSTLTYILNHERQDVIINYGVVRWDRTDITWDSIVYTWDEI